MFRGRPIRRQRSVLDFAEGGKFILTEIFFNETAQLFESKEIPLKKAFEYLHKYIYASGAKRDFTPPPLQLFTLFRRLCVFPNKSVRACAWRAIHTWLFDEEWASAAASLHLDFLCVRALERDVACKPERVQALKFVRKLMEISPLLVTKPILMGLNSIAANRDDPFCRISLSTLCQLAMACPQLVAECDIVKTLVNAITDERCAPLVTPLALALLFLLTSAKSRQYVHLEEILVLIAPFTDTNLRESDKDQYLAETLKTVVDLALRTWPGIFCLISHPLGLQSIVSALGMPSADLKLMVMRLIRDLFALPGMDLDQATYGPGSTIGSTALPTTGVLSPTGGAGPSGESQNPNNLEGCGSQMINVAALQSEKRRSRAQTRSAEALASSSTMIGITSALDAPSGSHHRSHVELAQQACILLGLLDCGFFESLVDVGHTPDKIVAAQATALLGDVLHLASVLLPSCHCARLQALPSLISRATASAAQRTNRTRASSIIRMLEELARHQVLAAPPTTPALTTLPRSTRSSSWSRPRGDKRQRIEELKVEVERSMDTSDFNAMLRESAVLTVKDEQKWDWRVIDEIVSGPLQSDERLAEALRTKFIRRLLKFFLPQRRKFSDMQRKPSSVLYARVGITLISLLVSTQASAEYLQDSNLFQEIQELLLIETQAVAEASEARLLGPDRIETTLCREYVAFIGVATRTRMGLSILNYHKVLQTLRELYELGTRDDLVCLALTAMDYTLPLQLPRSILSQAMTCARKAVRIHATKTVLAVLVAGIPDFHDWGIEILTTQLHDANEEVVTLALEILDVACDSPNNLISLVSKRPYLGSTQAGTALTLRFLSVNEGLEYMADSGFLDKELGEWALPDGHCVSYVETIDQLTSPIRKEECPHTPSLLRASCLLSRSSLPVHLYGELAKTENGCGVLKSYSVPREAMQALLPFLIPDTFNPKHPCTCLEQRPRLRSVSASEADGSSPSLTHPTPAQQPVPKLTVSTPSLPKTTDFLTSAALPLKLSPTEGEFGTSPSTPATPPLTPITSSPAPNPTPTPHTPGMGRRALSSSSNIGTIDEDEALVIDAASATPTTLVPSSTTATNRPTLTVSQAPPSSTQQQHLTVSPSVSPSSSSSSHATFENLRTLPLSSPNTPTKLGRSVDSAQRLKTNYGIVPSAIFGNSTAGPGSGRQSPNPFLPLDNNPFECEDAKRAVVAERFYSMDAHASYTPEELLQARAALWALGHIAASTPGLNLLRSMYPCLIYHIALLSRFSANFSLRSTAFQALGLVARTPQGQTLLLDLGWEPAPDPSIPLALPHNIGAFFTIHTPTDADGPGPFSKNLLQKEVTFPLAPDPDPKNKEGHIVSLMSNLSNHITSDSASRDLKKMRQNNPEVFNNTALFVTSLLLMRDHPYRLPVRRFLGDLFQPFSLFEEGFASFDALLAQHA